MSDRQAFHRYLQSRGIPSDLYQQDEAGAYEFATVEHDWEVWSAAKVGTSGASSFEEWWYGHDGVRQRQVAYLGYPCTKELAESIWNDGSRTTSGASAERERDWESTCDDCAGTGKVDHSEPLYVDGRYMGDDLFRIPCNTCLSCGVTVCLADIPKEIQR